MANWQQKLSKSITGIKGVDRNIARLTIRIDSLDDFFGTKPPLIIELHRELIVAAPEPVNSYLVDGKNYLSSDWLCEVAFLRVSGLDEFFAETFTMHQVEKDNLSSYIIEMIEKVIK